MGFFDDFGNVLRFLVGGTIGAIEGLLVAILLLAVAVGDVSAGSEMCVAIAIVCVVVGFFVGGFQEVTNDEL